PRDTYTAFLIQTSESEGCPVQKERDSRSTSPITRITSSLIADSRERIMLFHRMPDGLISEVQHAIACGEHDRPCFERNDHQQQRKDARRLRKNLACRDPDCQSRLVRKQLREGIR